MSARASKSVDSWMAEKMQDPEFQAAYHALEPAYQVARLRMLRGLTQKELAERLGTKQSSIARLESGKAMPSLSFLTRVIEVLDGTVEIRIRTREEFEEEERERRIRENPPV